MGINQKNILSQEVGVYRLEQNLYLRVQATGASFIFRHMKDGRRVDLGIGSAKKVSIARAKEIAAEYRAQIAKGVMPSREKKKEEKRARTFAEVAVEAVEKTNEVRQWKKADHKRVWLQMLRDYAIPKIGALPINEVSRRDIIAVLEPIWRTKTPTATTLRMVLERVFACAIFSGEYSGANPAVYRGNLDIILPPPSKIRTIKHRPALSLEELKKAMQIFVNTETSTAFAVAMTALTALRGNEVVCADWSEIDLKERIFSVPAIRRKVSRPYPHRVPLSDQAVAILQHLAKFGGDDGYVFKSLLRLGAHVSCASLLALISRTYPGKTVHGLRSTFRVWVEENHLDAVAAEYQMMHENPSEVVRAYQRSDLLEQRRKLMQQWADEILPMATLKAALEKTSK